MMMNVMGQTGSQVQKILDRKKSKPLQITSPTLEKSGKADMGLCINVTLIIPRLRSKYSVRDAAQGRSQFQQEVDVLSCIRHPNMGFCYSEACPEYGCLIYEYMANGSLDDRLFQRGKLHRFHGNSDSESLRKSRQVFFFFTRQSQNQ
ncbi:unnamed protein product [Rhodiola kirilowii]